MSNSKSWARLPSSRETGSPTQVWTFYSLAAGYPHSFRIEGAQPSRLLEVSVPAGFEKFFEEMGELAPEFVLTTPSPPDAEKLLVLG